jgi:hypothetical protein
MTCSMFPLISRYSSDNRVNRAVSFSIWPDRGGFKDAQFSAQYGL